MTRPPKKHLVYWYQNAKKELIEQDTSVQIFILHIIYHWLSFLIWLQTHICEWPVMEDRSVRIINLCNAVSFSIMKKRKNTKKKKRKKETLKLISLNAINMKEDNKEKPEKKAEEKKNFNRMKLATASLRFFWYLLPFLSLPHFFYGQIMCKYLFSIDLREIEMKTKIYYFFFLCYCCC